MAAHVLIFITGPSQAKLSRTAQQQLLMLALLGDEVRMDLGVRNVGITPVKEQSDI